MAANEHLSGARGDSEASRNSFPGTSGDVTPKKHTKCLKRVGKSCKSGQLCCYCFKCKATDCQILTDSSYFVQKLKGAARMLPVSGFHCTKVDNYLEK